ncbi:hypothetical protein ACFXPV_32115 [Streptomyces sp. NPDC059118]|uniref:hypothetical protein n=1 Tax=unclassified Streptomyces TaxID=2593676 RepID=UPI0036BFBD44
MIHGFYEYHRTEHGRPLINPFPAGRGASDTYVNAHHNPLQPWRRPGRPAPYQPKEPKRIPRAIPDEAFNELFAALSCHRDRAGSAWPTNSRTVADTPGRTSAYRSSTSPSRPLRHPA